MGLASPKSVRPSGGLEVPAGLDCCLESEGSLEAEFLPFGRGGGGGGSGGGGALSVFPYSLQLIG